MPQLTPASVSNAVRLEAFDNPSSPAENMPLTAAPASRYPPVPAARAALSYAV